MLYPSGRIFFNVGGLELELEPRGGFELELELEPRGGIEDIDILELEPKLEKEPKEGGAVNVSELITRDLDLYSSTD